MTLTKTIIMAAAGTGGHIFPALSVATLLKTQGINIQWVGVHSRDETKPSMENLLVPKHGFAFNGIDFKGFRGKGLIGWLSLPFKLFIAVHQCLKIYRTTKPALVVGMGGYITIPTVLAAKCYSIPVVIHEQNRLAGSANRWSSYMANRVLSGFPDSLPKAIAVGNPVRQEFFNVRPPEERMQARNQHTTSKALSIAVIGGSLGAQALNKVVPEGLSLWLSEHHSVYSDINVVHQCGRGHELATCQTYQQQGGIPLQAMPNGEFSVQWKNAHGHKTINITVKAFIDDMAALMSHSDMVICRAGAQTVSEVAAVGVCALFVPFPAAVDDHQTYNAKYLVDEQAAYLCAQKDLTASWLAAFLNQSTPALLLEKAMKARKMAMPQASEKMATICLELISEPAP